MIHRRIHWIYIPEEWELNVVAAKTMNLAGLDYAAVMVKLVPIFEQTARKNIPPWILGGSKT